MQVEQQKTRRYFYAEAATKVSLIIQWTIDISKDPNIIIRENLYDGLLELVEYCFCGNNNDMVEIPDEMNTSTSLKEVCRELSGAGGESFGGMKYYPKLLMKLRQWIIDTNEPIGLTVEELRKLQAFCVTVHKVEGKQAPAQVS